jgi:hypothetical protein
MLFLVYRSIVEGSCKYLLQHKNNFTGSLSYIQNYYCPVKFTCEKTIEDYIYYGEILPL